MKNNTFRSTQGGFGLVEVVIAAAIISVIALGISTLISDMFRMQRKANAVAAINQFRQTIISNIQNGDAWKATANANASMTCMQTSPSPCNVVAGGTDLDLKDITGAEIFTASAGVNGFRPDGGLCNTYPSDVCPFSWDLKWIATCPGAAASCMTPSVLVVGALEYTPASDPLPAGFNPSLYAIRVLRGSDAIRNDAVVVAYALDDPDPLARTGEPGSCKGAWVTRQLNVVRQDSGNNLINKAAPAPAALSTLNAVQLRAGTYTCRVQVPGFRNGGNRIRLVPTAGTMFPVILSSVGVAALNGGSVTMSIDTTLVLDQDTTFHVEHTCTNNAFDSGVPPNYYGNPAYLAPNDWSLGAPIETSPGVYTGVTYTTVSCQRTS